MFSQLRRASCFHISSTQLLKREVTVSNGYGRLIIAARLQNNATVYRRRRRSDGSHDVWTVQRSLLHANGILRYSTPHYIVCVRFIPLPFWGKGDIFRSRRNCVRTIGPIPSLSWPRIGFGSRDACEVGTTVAGPSGDHSLMLSRQESHGFPVSRPPSTFLLQWDFFSQRELYNSSRCDGIVRARACVYVKKSAQELISLHTPAPTQLGS